MDFLFLNPKIDLSSNFNINTFIANAKCVEKLKYQLLVGYMAYMGYKIKYDTLEQLLISVFLTTDDSSSGLCDKDYDASVATLKSLSESIDADCIFLREKKIKSNTQAQYLVRRRADVQDFMEVRYKINYFVFNSKNL